MITTPKQSAPRMQLAKNQTPYIVEYQWYSRLFTQKIAAKVRVSAPIGSPMAAETRFFLVQFASPSASWVNDAFRRRELSQTQRAKNATVEIVKTFMFSSTAFFS